MQARRVGGAGVRDNKDIEVTMKRIANGAINATFGRETDDHQGVNTALAELFLQPGSHEAREESFPDLEFARQGPDLVVVGTARSVATEREGLGWHTFAGHQQLQGITV